MMVRIDHHGQEPAEPMAIAWPATRRSAPAPETRTLEKPNARNFLRSARCQLIAQPS